VSLSSIDAHLERHPGLDFLPQDSRDLLVKMLHDTHGKLRLDSPAANQVIEDVRQGVADTESMYVLVYRAQHTDRGSEQAYDVVR